MIKKKICMVGGYAVGKTSLVRKYVKGIYDDSYITTVGVKIDQRTETVDGQDVQLMIWDVAGRDDFQVVQKSYLQAAAGFLYVADGTRRETLDAVQAEMAEIAALYPRAVPALLAVNKHDLADGWEIDDASLAPFREQGVPIVYTSAKDGSNVEQAFASLAAQILASRAS